MAKRPLLENPQADPTDEALNRVLDDAASQETGLAPIEPIAPVVEAAPAEATPAPAAEEVTKQQLYQALKSRYLAANKKIEDAKQMQRDAVKMLDDGQKELTDSRAALNKHFPPLTAAENVRQHLAAENAARVARVEAQKAHGITNPVSSHLDSIRNPGRGSVNRGFGRGRSEGTYARKQYGGVVPGSAADLAQAASRADRANFKA